MQDVHTTPLHPLTSSLGQRGYRVGGFAATMSVFKFQSRCCLDNKKIRPWDSPPPPETAKDISFHPSPRRPHPPQKKNKNDKQNAQK